MSLFQITFSVIFCFLVFFLMSLYYHRGFYLSILFFLFILSLFINQKFWIFTIFFICTYDDKIHICQNTKTPVSSVIFIISINLQSEKQPAVAIIYLFPSNPGISQSFHLEIPPACSTDDHIQLLYNL